jgi:hypothetical protein
MMLSLVCLLELRITLHATAFNGGRLRALLLPPEAAVEALLRWCPWSFSFLGSPAVQYIQGLSYAVMSVIKA